MTALRDKHRDGRPARRYGSAEWREGLELLKVKAPSIPIQEAVALRAEDVGHLHGGRFIFVSSGGRDRSDFVSAGDATDVRAD